MGTILVGGALVVIVALIIRGMVKDKKAGRSLQCGQNCVHCPGHCEQQK